MPIPCDNALYINYATKDGGFRDHLRESTDMSHGARWNILDVKCLHFAVRR